MNSRKKQWLKRKAAKRLEAKKKAKRDEETRRASMTPQQLMDEKYDPRYVHLTNTSVTGFDATKQSLMDAYSALTQNCLVRKDAWSGKDLGGSAMYKARAVQRMVNYAVDAYWAISKFKKILIEYGLASYDSDGKFRLNKDVREHMSKREEKTDETGH